MSMRRFCAGHDGDLGEQLAAVFYEQKLQGRLAGRDGDLAGGVGEADCV